MGTTTVCQLSQNGNMRAVPVQEATMPVSWSKWDGSLQTQGITLMTLGQRGQMLGGCSTCTETYRSGVKIYMMRTTIALAKALILRGQLLVSFVCCGADLGMSTLDLHVRARVTGVGRTHTMAASAPV